MKRSVSIALVVLFFGSIALGDAPKAPLSVNVHALRSSKGKVGCLLFASAKGYPSDPDAAAASLFCSIDGSSSTCVFDALTAGTYAVGCFHDENGNGKLDMGTFGPKEGTAASNNAKGSLGPPKWDDAKFTFSGQKSHIDIDMRY